MRPHRPRAVVFDLDGTLIDSVHDLCNVFDKMLEKRRLPVCDRRQIRPLVSHGADRMIEHAFGKAYKPQDRNELQAEFQQIYRTVPPDPVSLFPSTLEMLKVLKKQGHSVGICTNKTEDNAKRIVSGLGLDPYHQVLTGKREGRPVKPDPASLFETLRELNSTTADAAFVGDNEVDAETAVAAGVPFYLVTFGYPTGKIEEIPCAAHVDHFLQLPEILAA